MAKLEVYLNEYNILRDNAIYFPLVCGQLQAYAETKPLIRKNYQFMPFTFIRDHPGRILSQYQNPAVAAFSASMWNMNLNLTVAQQVKERFPDCLIVFGGPHTPLDPRDFFQLYPFIDVTVRGEGEHTFADLLLRLLDTRDFRDIPGVCYHNGDIYVRNEDRLLEENLDVFPSPYLEGVFDYLLPMDIDWQVIVETNRGCPFKCSFCFWNSGKRYRFFSLGRVEQIAEWCGANEIEYTFCADSNFGMIKRDLEIAYYFAEAKAKHGFPDKFRACCGKNAEDTIYRIGKLLTEYDMQKGITLSRQSNNPETLANVGRENIKLEVFNNLQKKYNDENIPTYTELILGLPGETYNSFLSGIEEILQSGIKNQLFVYVCQVYPNTKLATKEYQEKFKIQTVLIPLNEIHASVRTQEVPQEYEEIIVSTATMPVEDWKRALVVSWVMQLLHGLKLGFYILGYLAGHRHIKFTDFFEYIASLKPGYILGDEVLRFHQLADSIVEGKSRGCVMPDFGFIYWEPEEVSYLNILTNKDRFYDEMYSICKEYLGNEDDKLRKVINFQKDYVPSYSDKKTLARVLLYGRKSGKL